MKQPSRLSITLLLTFIIVWVTVFCISAFAQELPAIEATDSIYRVPAPTPLTINLIINDNGHLIAIDGDGSSVNFDALVANCEIMARDHRAMANMLQKIGKMARDGIRQ